jgi:putative DNA primase/helicase
MTSLSTKERARGRWRKILPTIGIDARFLVGRNCPCPMCGGKDRFRFIDRRGQDGDGMWVCHQCTPRPRPAIDLVIKFTGKQFKEAAGMVDTILGDRGLVRTPSSPPRDDKIRASAYADRVWRRGVPVRRGDVVDRYLRHRGVGLDIYPPCLRTSALDWYRDDETNVTSRHPAMFARICDATGKPVAVHRTFLAPDGVGKAQVATARKAAGRFGRSPTIRLTPAAPLIGIAEGIETALAAARLFRVPTWSVICTYGIETFEPPPECKHLVIFADNDRHGAGQRAAQALANRLQDGIAVEIRLPHLKDWNDFLLETNR